MAVARAGGNRRKVDVPPGERRRQALRLLGLVAPTATVLALLAGLGWLGYAKAVEGEALRIRELRIEGNERALREELVELCPVKPGDHLLLADTDLVERGLRRHPWVASAEVRRVLPPALEIRVTERRAVALVELGGLYLVDERGQVFKKAAPGDGLDLPLVTGLTRRDWLDGVPESSVRLDGALALLARWSEQRLDRKFPISQVHLDPDFGTTVWIGDDGVEIRLGTGDLPEKLARMERVLAAVQAEGKKAAVVHLDNRRRPDWVAVRFADSQLDVPARRGHP
ncbi:MAG: FtsQ-type POTRA domain-containing protein [Anaeromyxobacteraceae bacterium]